MGMPVRRPGYVKRSGIEDRTASRDLRALVDAGLLEARGQTKGRFYLADGRVRDLATEVRVSRAQLIDPFPELMHLVQRANDALRTQRANVARRGIADR